MSPYIYAVIFLLTILFVILSLASLLEGPSDVEDETEFECMECPQN